jgi:hypothetical protein
MRMEVPEGVVASVQHFDLENESDRKRLAGLQQQWQADTAIYVDIIGELKDAERFIENCFRRLPLYAGWRRDAEGDPIPVLSATKAAESDAEVPGIDDPATLNPDEFIDEKWARLAEDIVDGFAAREGGQSSLCARMGANIFLIGEVILVQRGVPERRPRGDEKPADVPLVWDWEARSPDEIIQSQSDSRKVAVRDSPDSKDGTPIVGIGLDPPFVERVYRRHWKWSAWADSNVRAATGTLETMRLLDLVERASLRSRAMAHVWTIPDELDYDAADQPGDGGAARKTVTFDKSFADAISASITNEADAASVAPTLVRGKAEFLKRDVFGPIEMPRRYGADERAQREEAVVRLGRTIELPQEHLTGVSDVNHWTAWQISEDTYRAYVEPLVEVMDEGLTYALLRPLMAAEGCPDDVLDRLVVCADPSRLIRRPDRGQVADKGVENDALSWVAWRKANGFGDDDAPSLEEQAMRIALKTRQSPEVGQAMLEQIGIIDQATADKIAQQQASAPAAGVADPAANDGTGDTGTPDNAGAPEAAAASAHRHPTRGGVGYRLAAMDANLRDRLLVLCDQQVMRSLERAGARLRARSQTPEVKEAVRAAADVPNWKLGQHLGPALVASALGAEPITEEDFAELHDRFDRWTSATQTAALAELAVLAGQRLGDAQVMNLRITQAEDRKQAWLALLSALTAYANKRLVVAEDAEEQTGEWEATAVVRPSLIRSVLAIAGGVAVLATALGGVERAGGGAAGGPATGDTMMAAFAEAGVDRQGYLWVYGSEGRVTPFEEHLALDGQEFLSFDDDELGGFFPGDHGNCLCDFVALFDENPGDGPE